MKILKKVLFFLLLSYSANLNAQALIDVTITNPSGSILTVKTKNTGSSDLTLGSGTELDVIVAIRYPYSYGNLTFSNISTSYGITLDQQTDDGSTYRYAVFSVASPGFTGSWSASTNNEITLFSTTVSGGSGTGSFDIVPTTGNTFESNNNLLYYFATSAGINEYENSVYGSGVSAVPLPVTLYNFSAAAEKTDAVLNWGTLSEYSDQCFTVERSLDGQNWTNLSFVPSKALNGNSQTKLSYTYTDANIGSSASVVYYRLTQQDLNGKTEVEGVRSVRFSAPQTVTMTVYPNPASNYVNVVVDKKEPVLYNVVDMKGNILLSGQFVSSANLDISAIHSGTYSLVVRSLDGAFVRQSSLVIAR
jgi:hypothetical protein